MEEKKRVRKVYSKNGTAQKMMSFKIDTENVEALQTVANKGRLINELIANWGASRKPIKDESKDDEDPSIHDLTYYQP